MCIASQSSDFFGTQCSYSELLVMRGSKHDTVQRWLKISWQSVH